MSVWAGRTGADRLQAYLGCIASVLGHAGRAAPMEAYCKGLLLPGERKSVELMAARLKPTDVRALHQSMHHVVAQAEWSDAAVLRTVGRLVLPAVERHGRITYWTLNTIAFPKQGSHSVGVEHQPAGPGEAPTRCQLAVSLSVTNRHASLPVAYRLSLPQTWAADPARCAKAGVPGSVGFETMAAIALAQVRQAHADGLPRGTVLGGVEYGDDVALRSGLDGLGLHYVLGVQTSTAVWLPSVLPAAESHGARKRAAQGRHDSAGNPATAASMARALPERAWRTVTWREDKQAGRRSRFAAMRVQAAHGPAGTAPHPEEWLLAEWPCGGTEPARCWLSNLPSDTPLMELVQGAMGRWHTVKDIQELRRDAGLGHYEGRGWRGFHHHASLSIASYGFLVAERCLFPPADRFSVGNITVPPRPDGFQPRGSARTTRINLLRPSPDTRTP